MTPDAAAAWVRENAWTQAMLTAYTEQSGAVHACACQWGGGACLPVRVPRHGDCHIGTPLPVCETYITWGGRNVAGFTEPYRHPSASATGWHRTTTAQVWLADRVCAWRCPCDCGHPRDVAHAPEKNPARPVRYTYEVIELPGLTVASC